MLTVILVALLALSVWPQPLVLRVDSPQAHVLAGEPVKIDLRFRALEPIGTFCSELAEFTSFCNRTLQFSVDDGQSVRTYQEDTRSLDERIVVLSGLRRGEGFDTTLVLFKGRYLDAPEALFLFPRGGRYRVRARYEGYGVKAESNWLAFEVAEPDADGGVILDAARRYPGLLGGWGGREGQRELAALLAAHPHHPYLRFARMGQLASDLSHRLSIGSPTWQEFKRQHERLDVIEFQRAWRTFASREYDVYARALLAEPDWGAFEDDKLLAIACAHGDAGERKRVRRALLKRFPRSDAGRRLKQGECGK